MTAKRKAPKTRVAKVSKAKPVATKSADKSVSDAEALAVLAAAHSDGSTGKLGDQNAAHVLSALKAAGHKITR